MITKEVLAAWRTNAEQMPAPGHRSDGGREVPAWVQDQGSAVSRRPALYWRYKVAVPQEVLELREALGVRPTATGDMIVGSARFAARTDAEKAAARFCAYVLDQYQVRPKPVTAELSRDAQARNQALASLRPKIVRVVHKPFGERHLIGYRLDVAGLDGVRRRLMSIGPPPMLSEGPLREGRGADETFQRQRDRGTLFRGAKAKEAIRRALDEVSRGHGASDIHWRICVYKSGPKPGPVAPELASAHRAEACARRKRFTTFKAAFAASKNALRRGIRLVPHGCEACGGFHVASKRNEVSA
jgi:hypothetical protein